MKKSILLFALILTGIFSFAQNTYNIVIFSEDGEPFYAYVNGIRQNDRPETNIKVTNLNSETLNMRIQFENKALPLLKQNMMPEFGYEHTVNIKKNVKKVMKLQYFGKVAFGQASQGSAATVQYHTAENPVSENNTQYDTGSSNGGSNTTITTTSTSINSYSDPHSTAVNINLGGMNVNTENGTTYNSITSTTVTSSSSSVDSSNDFYGQGKPNKNGVVETVVQPAVVGGCGVAMDQASYNKMKASVESKPFSDTKMSTAKVATKNTCLSALQIKGICSLFSMDDDKLTYAKYAYNYCVDKASYYQVSEAFSFSSTTDDLNKFLEEH